MEKYYRKNSSLKMARQWKSKISIRRPQKRWLDDIKQATDSTKSTTLVREREESYIQQWMVTGWKEEEKEGDRTW